MERELSSQRQSFQEQKLSQSNQLQTLPQRTETQKKQYCPFDRIKMLFVTVLIITSVVANQIQIRKLQEFNQKQIQKMGQKFIEQQIKNKQFTIEKQESAWRNTNDLLMKEVMNKIYNFEKQMSQLKQKLKTGQSVDKQLTSIREEFIKIRKNDAQMMKIRQQLVNRQKNEKQMDLRKQQFLDMYKKIKQAHYEIQKTQAKTIIDAMQKMNLTLSFLFEHAKQQFHYDKVQKFRRMPGPQELRSALVTAFDNMKLKHRDVILENQIKDNDRILYERLANQYQLDPHREQLSFCLVVPTYNNAKNFRYLYNLQSIMNLDYKNFKAFIIDDQSTDNTYELIQRFLQQHPDQRIKLFRNGKHTTALPIIDKIHRKYCKKTDIAVIVDGDDELLNKYSLKVFNSLYQYHKADILYSDFVMLNWLQMQAKKGWSESYSQMQKRQGLYRDVKQKIAHLRTWKVSLYLKIKPEDLRDQKGQFYTNDYDDVIVMPMLQMSCGRNHYFYELFYLYNFQIGTNDVMMSNSEQSKVRNQILRGKRRSQCVDQKQLN